MTRPPLWAWALPAALAFGLLVGSSARSGSWSRARAKTESVGPAQPVAGAAGVRPPVVDSALRISPADSSEGEWGVDGGEYTALGGSGVVVDTLPAAPPVDASDGVLEEVIRGDGAGRAPAAAELESSASGSAEPAARDERPRPAELIGRGAAFDRPLVAAPRGAGKVAFYSTWDAPASRLGLVGEWSVVGRCGAVARMTYEQPVGGRGSVRGVGETGVGGLAVISMVVPRQHCTAAAAAWNASRSPVGAELELSGSAFAGVAADAVVTERGRIWASSRQGGVLLDVTGESPRVVWSAAAPPGFVMRLLGCFRGEAYFVAVEDGGGRVGGVWRVSA